MSAQIYYSGAAVRIRDKTIHPTPVISSSCSTWQTDIKIQVLD